MTAPDVASALIESHPCFSRDAHKHARIHLPVAPACNVQCNYCNRKFDCSNESRPGVVSKLLSPSQAVERFAAVKKRMPNLSVAGIAGPGDPLANANATAATLRGIRKLDSDVHLCVSTNGLTLSEHIPMLRDLGVHHLTITMNAVYPETAAQLYAWIYHNGRRYRGLEGANILLAQQWQGLSDAMAAGLLIKVNTVLVPGVNTAEIEALATQLRSAGIFLHNVMPLISAPEHGTAFGMAQVRGPTSAELTQARVLASNQIPQMTHCQQCRADAIGTVQEGCPSERNDKLRVAVASQSGLAVDMHFGHAKAFFVFDLHQNDITFVERRDVEHYCTGLSDCDEQPSNTEGVFRALSDCQHVLCARIGRAPLVALSNIGCIPVCSFAYQPVQQALKELQSKLTLTVVQEAC